MDELLKAIYTLYSGAGGASLRTASPGGMWLSTAPKGATGVYIVVVPVAAPTAYAMGGAYTQDCHIQFTISTLAGSATDVVGAMSALRTLYDFCSLTMTGHTLLMAMRKGEQGPLFDTETRGYFAHVEYLFMIGG